MDRGGSRSSILKGVKLPSLLPIDPEMPPPPAATSAAALAAIAPIVVGDAILAFFELRW